MKKILDWIKSNWKLLLEILGGAIATIIALEWFTNKGGQPLIPDIDEKKEDKQIDIHTQDEIKSIDITAKDKIASIKAETPEQIKAGLSVDTQLKIQDIKDKAIDDIANNIMKDLQ